MLDMDRTGFDTGIASGTSPNYLSGKTYITNLEGYSDRSADNIRIGTIAGTTGDPNIRFTNTHDTAIGDTDESTDGTRIEVKDSNQSISLIGNVTASGAISASGLLTVDEHRISEGISLDGTSGYQVGSHFIVQPSSISVPITTDGLVSGLAGSFEHMVNLEHLKGGQ